MAVGCATGTVHGFVLRFRAAGDADADARAGIFQQLIAPDGSQCDVPDPRRQHDNPCKPTPPRRRVLGSLLRLLGVGRGSAGAVAGRAGGTDDGIQCGDTCVHDEAHEQLPAVGE